MDTTNLWRTNLGTMDVGPAGLGSAIFGEGDAEAIAPARPRAGNDAGPSAVAAGGGSDTGGGRAGDVSVGGGGVDPDGDTSAAAAQRGSRGIESAILGAGGDGPNGEGNANGANAMGGDGLSPVGSANDGVSGDSLSLPAGNAFPEKLVSNAAAEEPIGAGAFGAESFNAASYELNLSREEQTLYQHHLNQLALQRGGGSYVDGIVGRNGNGGARNGASNRPAHGAMGPGTTAAASGNANGWTGPNPNAAPAGNAMGVAGPNADAAAHGNASGAPSGNAHGSTGLNITAAPAGSSNRTTGHEANGTTARDGDGSPARHPNRASSNPAVLGQNRHVWIEGRTYVIPSVWDGKLVFTSEAVKRARQVGLEQWPSYATGTEATMRDEAMRTFMVQEASKPAEAVPATAPSQQARRNGDDILTDFHGWLTRQDDNTRQSIGDYLRSVPVGGLPAARQKLAAMYAVAEQSGMDIFTVRENWELIRGGVSEQRDWGSAKFDDETFYHQMRHGAQERKGQRDLLLGSDADDAVGKASREASLANFMFRSVLLGYSAPKAHRLWQQQASKLPNYRKEHEDLYLALSQDFHKEATTRLAPVYDLAREAFSAVFTFSDLEEASEALHPRYSALSEEHQRLMLATVRAMADVMPDKTRQTFWSNLGEALGRGTSRTGRGLADFGSALWEMKKLELSFYLPFMSPSEQIQDIEEKIGEHNLESDLRRAQETNYSPIKQVMGDIMPAMVERAIYGTMDAIPSFALAAVPVVGLPATFASMTSNAYENVRFRGIDHGLSDADATKRAFLLAPIIALPEAALERLGVRAGLGKLPFLNKALDKLAGRIGGGVLGGTAKFVGRGVAETFTETAQGFMQPIVETIAHALDKDSPGVVWQNGKDGVLDGLWTQVPETFLTVLPFSGLGFFNRGARRVEGLSGASDLQLQAFGARLADIATFRDAVQRGEFSAEMAADELLQRRDANSPEARVAVEQLTRLERAKAVEANAANVSAMEEAGVTRMARSADGWTVEHADGEVTRVNSARAALTVVHSLRQVATQREADSLVSMIDRWHDAAPAGVARETVLTGEAARSDGRTITFSRDGAVTREVANEGDLQRLREQARMDAQRGGHADIDVAINGANWVGKVANGAREMVQRLEIHRSPSSALAFLHESVEADLRLGIQSGAITREETQQAIASVAKALDPARARDASERAFRERVQRVASGTASEIELRETLSELAVADVLGRRRDGTTMPAGRVSAALEAALQTATDPAQVRAVGKLRAFLRAVRANLRAMFGTMAALRKARREGGAREFDALVSKLFGKDWQAAKEWATSQALDGTSELEGAAFSLSRSSPERNARMIEPVQIRTGALPGRRADWRKAVRDYITAHLQGKEIVNKDTGWKIGFTAESKAEAPGKLRREPAMRSALHLESIVERAIHLGEVSPKASRARDTERMDYFAVPVEVDGRPAVAWFNVRKHLRDGAQTFYEFGLYEEGAAQATQGLGTAELSNTPQPMPHPTIGEFLQKIKNVLPAAIKVREGANVDGDIVNEPPGAALDSSTDEGAAFSLSRRDYRLDERGVHPLAKPTTETTITDHERARNPASVLQDVLRGAGALREDVRTDRPQRWKHGRQVASHSRLYAWAERRARVLESVSLFTGEGRERGGGEHTAFVDAKSGRVVKLTKPALYGAHGDDAGAYLQRWALSNRVFGDDVRVEGMVTLPGEHEARVVISQRFVEGRDSTTQEIADYLMGKGFRRSNEGRWVQPITGLAVWDVAPGNAITSADGQVHPIDLIIEPASPRELREVREQSGIGVDLENQRPGQESRADEGVAFHLAPNASAIQNTAQTPGRGTQTQAASEIPDRRAGATARRTLLSDVSEWDAGTQEGAHAPPGDADPTTPQPEVRTTYEWKTPPTSARTIIETLEREIAPIEKRIAEIKAKLMMRKPKHRTTAEFKQDRLLLDEWKALNRRSVELGRAISAIPPHLRGLIAPVNTPPQELDALFYGGAEIATAYTHPDLLPAVKVALQEPGKTAEYRNETIFYSPATSRSTVAHEMTHGTEQQHAEILAAAKAFLEARTKGETPRRLAELTGDERYGDRLAYEDQWGKLGGHPYSGRIYPDGHATEILTVGIQRLHHDPLLFARQDPEYFSFVVNTLRKW